MITIESRLAILSPSKIMLLVLNYFKLVLHKFVKCTVTEDVPVDLGCTDWNETPSTCHDQPIMRFSTIKHPDASGNSHCPYGSVKNIESQLSYKR